MKLSLLRLLGMIKKEFRFLKAEPANLLVSLLLPSLIIILFAFMTSSSKVATEINVTVVSNDSNSFINPNNYTESKIDNYTIPYVKAVNDSKHLNLIHFYNTSKEIYAMESAREQLLKGKIKCIIVLPVEFSELLISKYPGIVECVPDASDVANIQSILNSVYDSIKVFTKENNLTPYFKVKGFEEFSFPRTVQSRFNSSMAILLPIMVYGISIVLTMLVIVREKPIARLLLTPAKRMEILISKYITYILLLIAQISLILLSAFLGGLYNRGSLLDLFMGLFILGFSGVTMGMFISSLSKTKNEANQLFFAFFIIAILLSGLIVPIESMPIFLQPIAFVLPLSHGNQMINSVLTKGNSIFGFNFFALLGLSAALIFATIIIFEKRKYEA
ncbi:MAG: ABC transporter permease [Candidatus Lokiarchaeota archaeon]